MQRISRMTYFFTLCMIFLGGSVAMSQVQISTFHSDVDDTEQPYGLYLPPKYTPKKKYPLVVMLHGAGSNHRLSMRRVFGKSNFPGESDIEASLYFPEWPPVEMIVVTPLARGTMGYQGIAEKDVWDMLADVEAKYSVDPDRRYLTGLSMGGGGTLWIGLTRPDYWAAIAPVCPAIPAMTDVYYPQAKGLPVKVFHGDEDPVVKVESSRVLVSALKSAGANVTYTEYPGVKHDSWVDAYANGAIFNWFASFKRNAQPTEVSISTLRLRYGKSYWAEITDFPAGDTAQLHAAWRSNQLHVTTSHVEGIAFDLTQPSWIGKVAIIDLVLDGQTLQVANPRRRIELVKESGRWREGRSNASRTSQVEGPIIEAFGGRHLYVFGTKDQPDAKTSEKRYQEALKAAEWSFHRGDFLNRVLVFPRVVADRDLRLSDWKRSNLVAFGTATTNGVVDSVAKQLPVVLKENQVQNYGLTAWVPSKYAKYVVVQSGLPWWEAPATSTPGLLARLTIPGPVGLLRNKGDFFLFEKDSGKIQITGHYSKNWKISENDTQKLEKTGAVLIR